MAQRFGGIYSSLNKRDIQTLTDFELFLSIAQDNELNDLEGTFEYKPGDALLPDAENFDVRVPGEFVSESLEGIYYYFDWLYRELVHQCKQPSGGHHLGNQELDIEIKHQCRIWLGRIAPILRKLANLIRKHTGEYPVDLTLD